jgi:hypothetical protein
MANTVLGRELVSIRSFALFVGVSNDRPPQVHSGNKEEVEKS